MNFESPGKAAVSIDIRPPDWYRACVCVGGVENVCLQPKDCISTACQKRHGAAASSLSDLRSASTIDLLIHPLVHRR